VKKKCTSEQFETISEMLYQLTDILLAVGVAELKISAKERDIYWDTQNGGMVDGEHLDRFAALLDRYCVERMLA
jgi:hypothetical protein